MFCTTVMCSGTQPEMRDFEQFIGWLDRNL